MNPETAAPAAASPTGGLSNPDDLPALIWRLDAESRGHSFNGAWRLFSGLSDIDLAGDGWLAAVHPEDRKSLAVRDPSHGSASFDVRIRGRDGEYRWFLVNRGGFGLAPPPRGSALVAVPIDSRKEAESARDRELADVRATLQNVPTMIWRTTASGEMDYANDRYLATWKQTSDQISGWGWKDSVHPEDQAGMVSYWVGHVGSDSDGVYEFRAGTPETGYRWYVSISTARRDPDGKVLNWYGATFDIEDRRQAEDRLRCSEAFLRQGQLISKTGSVGANFKTGEHTWSEETYRILELDPSVTPSFEAFLQRVHPDDLGLVTDALDRIEREEADVEFEHRLRMPDDRIKHLRVLANPAHADFGDLSAIGVIMDVTAAKLAEEEMHRSQAELTRITRIATMAELTASMAHEINQPLSGILTNSEACLRWINRAEPDIDEAREAVERAVAGAQRVSQVVRQLRAIFTRKGPDPVKLSLGELVNSTLPLLRSQLNQYRAVVALRLADGLPCVVADPIQIQQVLINLVTNGLQAPRKPGAVERRLLIETSHAEGSVTLSVSDDGLGLDESQLSQLFDPFFTTKPEGMGMGLSLCRSIVESHGGATFARNQASGGATVGFTLPVQPPLRAPRYETAVRTPS